LVNEWPIAVSLERQSTHLVLYFENSDNERAEYGESEKGCNTHDAGIQDSTVCQGCAQGRNY
jgi:hypothetical protein